MSFINHRRTHKSIDATNDLATTPVIRVEGLYNAVMIESAPANAMTLTFYGYNATTGTYQKLRRRAAADTDWTSFEDVAMTVGTTVGVYPLPDEARTVPYIKIVLSGTSITEETLSIFQTDSGDYVNEG